MYWLFWVLLFVVVLLNIRSLPGAYHLRVAWAALQGWQVRRSRQAWEPLVGLKLSFYVLLSDLDFYLHMNNAAYLSYCDIGRFHLFTALGVLSHRNERWNIINGGQYISYRRSLMPFQKFELLTRIHSYDEKWMYIEHRFLSKGKTCASAIVKMIFKRGLETIPPAKALQIMGYGTLTPELMTSEIGTHTKGVESVLHSNGM